MSLSVDTLAVARKYTDDSLAGAGAVAGVPCKIQSITAITGGNRVTFLWTDNNGDDHTSAMDVMNGVDGEDGKGIQSVSVNAENHLIITYTDGTTVDAGQIEIHSAVDSVNGQTGAVVLDAEDVGALPDNTPIPSKTSDLTNDSGFVTTSDVSTALADYTTTADLTTLLAAKQDTLTFDNAPTENSDNPVKSGGVYAVNEALTNQVNDIVNVLGAKNLIPFPYHRQSGYTTNNATFTYDDEGVITVNKVAGNATAYFGLFSNTLYPNAEIFIVPNTSYILSMELENATDTSCFVQTQNGIDLAAIRNKATGKYEISFTTPETIDFLAVALYYGAAITENNAKVKLMIRLASIQDDTWVPYVPTNKELMSCKLNGYVGAKNLLAYPYKHTTKSENGVTFTDNGDGTITVNTPTSASAETTFYLSQSIQSILDTGMYILSGCPSGGNRTSGYFMEFAELATSSSDWKMFGTDTGEGAIAHIDSTRYAIHAYIRIRSGATVSNLTFKPMIRRVEDTDPTWQPYAMTNRELTEKIDIVGNLFTTTTKVADNITHNIATTIATLENLPIGTYVVSGQFNSDSAMSGGGLVQFASYGVIQNGASCNPIINQGFKANAGLTGIFNVTNATNQINLQIYTATADLTVSSARLAAIRIA